MALSLIQSLEDAVAISGFTGTLAGRPVVCFEVPSSSSSFTPTFLTLVCCVGLLLVDLWANLKSSLGREVTEPLKGFFWREILRRNDLSSGDASKFFLFLSSPNGIRSCASPPYVFLL